MKLVWAIYLKIGVRSDHATPAIPVTHWCSQGQNLKAKASTLKAKGWTFEAKALDPRLRPLSIR